MGAPPRTWHRASFRSPLDSGGLLIWDLVSQMGAKAYLLTWTTYGSWLPGDSRGWVDRHRTHGEVIESPDPLRERLARKAMRKSPVTLCSELRSVVFDSIRRAAKFRGWHIHALDVRSNHVHVVIAAGNQASGEVMRVLKAYASRELTQSVSSRKGPWWTRQGSKRQLFTDSAVAAAVRYVLTQDTAWMKE